jgi:HJR/Mrr/RecB family endonuclease
MPSHFGLTSERALHLAAIEKQCEEQSFFEPLLWTTWAVIALYTVTKHGFSSLLPAFLFGILPAGVVALILDSVAKQAFRRINFFRLSSAKDYEKYVQFKKAIALHRARIIEISRRLEEQEREARSRAELELRKQVDWWKKLDGYEFEQELATLMRRRGFEVKHMGKSGDQGVDLMMSSREGKRIVVQCKAQRNYVSPSVVRDLYGTMIHHNVDEAWLVATCGFNKGSNEFAQGKPIKLFTISQLLSEASARSDVR